MAENGTEPTRTDRPNVRAANWGFIAGLLAFPVGALVVFMGLPFPPMSGKNLWPMVCGGSITGLITFFLARKWLLRKYYLEEDED